MVIRQENLFIIGYGLGGSFGGIQNYEVVNVPDLETASKEAYYRACEEYEGFEGMYGLKTYEECLEEAEGVDELAEEIFNEEKENWIDYSAFPWSKEEEKLAKRYHYNNPFYEVTSKKKRNNEDIRNI